MIRYCTDYNGTITNISTPNAVPSATNTDITNDSFDDYFQPTSIPFDVSIEVGIDSDALCLCIGFGSGVTATVDGNVYQVNKLGTLIIDGIFTAGETKVVTINSSSIMALNFLQFATAKILDGEYQSGFLLADLVSARNNLSVENFGLPTGQVEKRKALNVTLNLPNMLKTNMPMIDGFKNTTELKVVDFDGVYMVIFDIIINTSVHATTPLLVVVSAKYKVWGN